jgi:3-deoxy-D-manno-octulosonic-acid transferase
MLAQPLYTLLWHAALPLVLARLAWRARRQPAYLAHLAERFGRPTGQRSGPVIWVHAVSVGETRAAAGLVRTLLSRYPRHRILLTHMTPTGRDTGAELFGAEARVLRAYLPYDLPWAATAFLARVRPDLGLIMETEVWPNLFAACARAGIPLALVNARLSARSARGYRRIGRLARQALGRLRLVAAQTREDAQRLAALGARQVQVTGNIKFDASPPPAQLALGDDFRGLAGGRRVLLAASTREGEEALLLDAFAGRAGPEVLLVLVPRHPQRFDAVAQLVQARDLPLQRRSEGTPLRPQTRVWLGDSMGEMFAYYRAADVALIGGSWLPYGGQNLIEACAVGCPVVVGPHTFNFAQVAEEACALGAAVREADAAAGVAAALQLLEDAPRRQAMGRAGRGFVADHQGATARTLALIAELLPPPPGDASCGSASGGG